ncbi:helix-turn-helix domain-containing protein [Sulfolobus acidocaldarius]|uniref:helix-turn-helix domain-containing protein n=1 Tax=Sulfolobus acidocaldarius TaxID=2285 RepID=UPI000786548F|nr:helix-turn-helix domain-containing protein [Sulfolobus acidocaldarius]
MVFASKRPIEVTLRPIEVTLLVDKHPCEVLDIFRKYEIKAQITNVKLRDQVTDHIAFLKINDDILKELKRRSLKTLRINENTIWIRTNGCGVCKLLYHSDLIVEKVKVLSKATVMYKLLLPNLSALKQFLEELNSIRVEATVANVSEIDESELTDRQLEILRLAYKSGYFDVDRKISMKELANKLGIKASTLEEILRRALKKAVKYYLDRKS